MEKEEKIVAVLLVMGLLSLVVAYVTFYQGNERDIANSGIQFNEQSSIGSHVYLEGMILSKRFTFKGDHLLLSVEHDQHAVKVFIPKNNGAEYIDKLVNENDYVHIKGIVDEYEGEREVIVQNKNGVIML
ncbi:MAG: OB-fold nucleic acid binding domain-containing protein [Methanosarcinaceae archaeon]